MSGGGGEISLLSVLGPQEVLHALEVRVFVEAAVPVSHEELDAEHQLHHIADPVSPVAQVNNHPVSFLLRQVVEPDSELSSIILKSLLDSLGHLLGVFVRGVRRASVEHNDVCLRTPPQRDSVVDHDAVEALLLPLIPQVLTQLLVAVNVDDDEYIVLVLVLSEDLSSEPLPEFIDHIVVLGLLLEGQGDGLLSNQ